MYTVCRIGPVSELNKGKRLFQVDLILTDENVLEFYQKQSQRDQRSTTSLLKMCKRSLED